MSEVQKIYFGVENYPLFDETIDGKLGCRMNNDNPIVLNSSVTPPEGVDLQEYAYGVYIRNLPVRGLTRATVSEFDRRNLINDANTKTYASGFLGAPGTGKTHFFSNLSRMTHEKGALLVDCSDRDVRTLFEEPVFDSQSVHQFTAPIDAKIQLRNKGAEQGISNESLGLLKDILQDAYLVDANGFISIDWSGIHFDGNDMDSYNHQVQVFQNLLKEVCKIEGINVDSASKGVGIVMQDGELFRVFDKKSPDYGRPVILDEVNRAKGTLDSLYGLLNFLNSPNMQTFRITGANGRQIVVDKNDMPATFYLNFTGNQAIDGMGSQVFNDPFLSRVPEGFALRTIPDLKPVDFADMISSHLTGGSRNND